MTVTSLRTVDAVCHEITVDLLIDLLERAQAGEVIGIVAAIECAGHYEYASTVSDRARMIGMMQLAILAKAQE